MGWASCGTDSKGRKIGYAHSGRCDHEGCKAKIDRGLGYACGDMHGSEGFACEGYFCTSHLTYRWDPDEQKGHQYCTTCAERLDAHRAEEFQEVLEDFVKAKPKPTYRLVEVDRTRPVTNDESVTVVLDVYRVDDDATEDDDGLVGHVVRTDSAKSKDLPKFEYHEAAGATGVMPFTLGYNLKAALDRFQKLMQPSKPTTVEQHMQAIYDLLLRWDEVGALKPDLTYMTQEKFDYVVRRQKSFAEIKKLAHQHVASKQADA